jgi:hypothetical protein
LPGYWLVREEPGLGPSLRLSHDALGLELYPTPAEAAERRIRELEAALTERNR